MSKPAGVPRSEYVVEMCSTCGKSKPCTYVIVSDPCVCEKREPRNNPKVGDIFLLGEERRTVEQIGLSQVVFITTAISHPHSWGVSSCTIEKWRRWAKNAEVVYAAE